MHSFFSILSVCLILWQLIDVTFLSLPFLSPTWYLVLVVFFFLLDLLFVGFVADVKVDGVRPKIVPK